MPSDVGDRRRILAVALPSDARDTVESALDDATLTSVETEADCLDRLESNGVRGVVVGDELPTTGCIDLVATIRSNRPTLPIVVYPSTGSEQLAARAFDAGATGYVPGTDDAEQAARTLESSLGLQTGRPTEHTDRYRNLVRSAPVPINLFDRDGTIVWGNDALLDLLDVDDRATLVGRSIFEFIESQNDATARSELAGVFEDETPVGPTEFIVRSETGAIRQIQVTTSPADFAGRRVAQAIILDVTELETAIDELRTQRDLLTNTLDTLQDAFYLLSPEGEFERWNHRICEVTGYSDDELAEMTATDLIHPDDEQAVRDAIQTAIEDGASYTEVTVQAKSGATRRFEFRSDRLDAPDGTIRGIVGIGRDVTEQRRMERTLRENEQRYRTLVELSPNPILVHRDGHILYANDAMLELIGVDDPEAVHGTRVVDYLRTDEHDEAAARMRRTQAGPARSQHSVRELETEAGDVRHVETTSRRITFEGEPAVLTVGQDVTERREHHQTLTALHELTRTMMAADTRAEIATIAPEAAVDLLDVDVAGVFGFEDAQNALQLLDAASDADASVPDGLEASQTEGVLWDAFVDQTAHHWTAEDTSIVARTGLTSGSTLPLGNHGVLVVGRTDAPDRGPASDAESRPIQAEAARLLAQNLEAAFDVAERTEALRERDERLAAKNESLTRLDRLNAIVRQSTQAIARSTTRDEVLTNVCEEFAEPGHYEFVWHAERDPGGDGLTMRRWAGRSAEYADKLADGPGTPLEDLAASALETDSVQVQQNVRTDPAWEAIRRDALTYGFRAVAAVPIVRDTRTTGVFVIHAANDGVFDDEEQTVLSELGRTVGYALRSVERNVAIESDERTELELSIVSDHFFLNRLADATETTVEFVGGVPASNGALRAFLRFENPDEGAVVAVVSDWESVTDVRPLAATDGGGLYQLDLATPTVIDRCQATGAVVRSMQARDGETLAHVDLPPSVDVRTFVETIQEQYPETVLVARRARTVPLDTRETFRDQIRGALTDRQFEALATAHYGGFYDWPRQSSTADLGDMLDIASSTFQYHLRAAERKVVEALLDETDPQTDRD